jgi:hypothetical protein
MAVVMVDKRESALGWGFTCRYIGHRESPNPAGGTLVFKGSDLNEMGPVTLPEARW